MAELTIHPLVGRDELERDIKKGNRGHCSAEAITSNLRESACRRGEEPKAAVISVASSPVAAPNLEGYSVDIVLIITRRANKNQILRSTLRSDENAGVTKVSP